MQFRVIAILRNAGGELAEMQCLKSGRAFDVMHSVASVLAMDNDRPWAELVSIHIDVLEG